VSSRRKRKRPVSSNSRVVVPDTSFSVILPGMRALVPTIIATRAIQTQEKIDTLEQAALESEIEFIDKLLTLFELAGYARGLSTSTKFCSDEGVDQVKEPMKSILCELYVAFEECEEFFTKDQEFVRKYNETHDQYKRLRKQK